MPDVLIDIQGAYASLAEERLGKEIENLVPEWKVAYHASKRPPSAEPSIRENESQAKPDPGASGQPGRSVALPDPGQMVEVLQVVVAWEVLQRAAAERFIARLDEFAQEHWRQFRRTVDLYVVTEDGQEVHHIRAPAGHDRKPRERSRLASFARRLFRREPSK